MIRGTRGTGMMSPLQMANSFNGGYYSGPSGASVGAVNIAAALSDGLMNLRARQDYEAQQAQAQQEKDRARMEELNQRQAVAQAINPYKAAESSGMGNRDMSRRMSLPDAGTQIALAKMQEQKAAQAQEARNKQLTSLATLWYANGGEKTDPGGAKFQQRFGVSPYEYIPQGVITSMANLDLRRDLADESRQTRIALANMGRGGGAKLPSAQGYETYIAPDGSYQMRPIPGGPADVKQQALADKQAGTQEMKERKADLLSEDIDRAVDMAKDYWFIPNTGVGSALSVVPGTKAHDLSQMLDGIKARIGFDALQEMRDNSPTGGALGQVSENENKLLQSIYGSLSQSQTEKEFIYNLNRLKQKYNDVVHGRGNWREDGGQIVVAPGGGQQGSYRGTVNRQPDMKSDADALIEKYGSK